MPNYSYECNHCGTHYDIRVPFPQRDLVTCPRDKTFLKRLPHFFSLLIQIPMSFHTSWHDIVPRKGTEEDKKWKKVASANQMLRSSERVGVRYAKGDV